MAQEAQVFEEDLREGNQIDTTSIFPSTKRHFRSHPEVPAFQGTPAPPCYELSPLVSRIASKRLFEEALLERKRRTKRRPRTFMQPNCQ